MELYLSIPIAVTAIMLIAVPLFIGGGVALVGHSFAGSHGAWTGFRDIYWRALAATTAIAAALWLGYGAIIFFVWILS